MFSDIQLNLWSSLYQLWYQGKKSRNPESVFWTTADMWLQYGSLLTNGHDLQVNRLIISEFSDLIWLKNINMYFFQTRFFCIIFCTNQFFNSFLQYSLCHFLQKQLLPSNPTPGYQTFIYLDLHRIRQLSTVNTFHCSTAEKKSC